MSYRIVYTSFEEEVSVDSTANSYEEAYDEAYTLTDEAYFVIYQTILSPKTVKGSYEIRLGDLYTAPDYSLNRSHNA